MVFPNHINWYQGVEICRRFGGRMELNLNEKDLVEKSFALRIEVEKRNPDRCKRVWMAASDEETEKIWKDSETGEVVDIDRLWAPGQPNGERIQNCAGIWELAGMGSQLYDDGGCEGEKQCTMCKFKLAPRAKLRGLCRNKLVDTYYSLMWDDVEKMPYYQGFRTTKMTYDESEGAWSFLAFDKWLNTSVTGKAVIALDAMGTGSAEWNFSEDVCGDNNSPRTLKMTVCKRNEFTCAKDGTCISMDQRCDQFPNCADFSDEQECNLVVPGAGYVKDFTPFTLDMEGKVVELKLFVRVELIEILEIDEVGKIFSNQFELFMTWYDYRLNFYNMKVNQFMNTLTKDEKSMIWVPSLTFSNTESKINTVLDNKAKIAETTTIHTVMIR